MENLAENLGQADLSLSAFTKAIQIEGI